MPTHHDYDADGTIRDEMLSAQEDERDELELKLKASSLPSNTGFYWWRETPSHAWSMMMVMGHDENLWADDISHGKFSGRTISVWLKHFPVGEWIEVLPP